MAISVTISTPYARRWAGNARRARTKGADAGAASYASRLREGSGRFANIDFSYQKPRIAAQLP